MLQKTNRHFYGVYIIKQIQIIGDPDLIDHNYDDSVNTFEESVMVVYAQSFDHAYKIAEQKAKEEKQPHTNIYDQKVLWKFIEAVDCYQIAEDKLESGTEVFSALYETEKDITAEKFLTERFGGKVSEH